ncbi:MAG TPA: hypothetical protein VLF67_03540 [Candidatus Saccharimonas sp.]|nr:hypothetical protein [Candidatus Saccharimonas sp.]
MDEYRVGVVGYCPPSEFDEAEARRLLRVAFDAIEQLRAGRPVAIVSGLSDVGVLAIAYRQAASRGWKTVGVASKKTLNYPSFPVDERHIVGENWGDESPTFLSMIHAIIRIGGGEQSLREQEACQAAGKLVFAYELPRLN